MYEHITFETIMNGMLDRVPADMDKREGSIIWNALAPAAVELQNAYIDLDALLDETFADTAGMEFLTRRCAERGITPYEATKAIVKGEFNLDMVPLGARFSGDKLNYVVTEKIAAGQYRLECETAGTEGNAYIGAIIPIGYINGLTRAAITEVLIPGEDLEEEEHLRQRYFNSLDALAFGGNVADYVEKVNAISGVGGVKVTPTWNGGGTVKLTIISSDYTVPTTALITKVQTDVDPTQNQGAGLGIAPIGHVVTVEGVTETIVNITSTITFAQGWTFADLKASIEEAVDDYLKELCTDWATEDSLIVRISQIETRILELQGVTDIAATKINGEERNLTLDAAKIPKRGDIVA